MVKEILRLGDPRLYEKSAKIAEPDLRYLQEWVTDLRDTLLSYRAQYGAGRAIALPQIGIRKRLIYMLTDKEYIFINPELSFPDRRQYTVQEDCLSFPGLCVNVRRYVSAYIRYLDGEFKPRTMSLTGESSELLQHEYDHLDGILATMRAVDSKSFCLMQLKR